MTAMFLPKRLFSDAEGLREVPLGEFLSDLLGAEWTNYEHATLVSALSEQGVGPDTFMMERIQALQLMLTNSAPWEEWGVFEKCCATINGLFPVFSLVQPPEAEHIACALYVMKKLAPWEFSEEVKRYMLAACLNDGHWALEGDLELLQPYLDEHDAEEGITRDYRAVADLLKRSDGAYVDPPSNAADVQLNNVLSVREYLSVYRDEEAKQRAFLRELTS